MRYDVLIIEQDFFAARAHMRVAMCMLEIGPQIRLRTASEGFGFVTKSGAHTCSFPGPKLKSLKWNNVSAASS